MAIKSEWNGTYYDGQSAVPHHVTVTVQPSRLQIRTNSGTTYSWPYSELTQTQGRYSGEEVRLERGTGVCETLVVPDNDILRAIHRSAPEKVGHLHNPAHKHKRLLFTVLAGVVSIPLFWAVFTWGIPWLATPITALIPVAWEQQLGQFIANEIAPPEKQCQDPQLRKALGTIAKTLSQPLQSNPYTFTITVVDNPTFNALAAPGGNILVFRGLLKGTQTPEELAGVLAHEMQHILLRHGMRMLVQQISMAFAVAALSGDASGIMTFGLQAAHTLQSLSYSRGAEEQADEQGLRLLLRAKLDPKGMMAFFDNLKDRHQPGPLSQYLSTHPSAEERMSRLKALAENNPSQQTNPLLQQSNWSQIRELCDSSQEKPEKSSKD